MIAKINSFFRKAAPLSVHAKDVTSQFGEDGIIAHIISVVGPTEKYCVEFGAWDGKLYSNCFSLLTASEWRGAMIEVNSDKFKELVETYAAYPGVTPINRMVDFEGPDRLDAILADAGAPKNFGLVSIDIDGNDYHVWDSLVEHTPEIVVIEFNPTIPNDVEYVQDRSFDVNIGCSLLALVKLGKQKGYELVATTQVNAFFVRTEKYPLFGITNNFICSMHTPMQDGRIFQGMDGSIHVLGMDRMIWRGGMRVSSADFQVVPKAEQGWHDAQKK